ncbi:Carnosine N-methyltransferase [Frankliniella fusca]|uniref:Carnosine N-methyltransferase n=1 Tax=Frankliniella fusca TaxID=407009 RepID=A0AAE1HYI5_9NEOP|nr:Carnosine N-methyltransferase [Frankliniella fusca]
MEVDEGIGNTPTNPLEIEEERHFRRIVCAFKYYKKNSLARINKTEAYLDSLPGHHQDMLFKYKQHLGVIRQCVEKNEKIINHIIKDVDSMFANVHPDNADNHYSNINHLSMSNEFERVETTLKQLVRDWSAEGAKERLMCYQPIIDEVLKNFPPSQCDPGNIKVLVPGAGLGRLAFELARNGYQCQGNEFSLFMLFASNFVLNGIRSTNAYEVFPWIHQANNVLKAESQIRGILFPDVNPSDLPPTSQFSMAAGDFQEVYVDPEHWDCVATCFFIDCGHNIVSFIETIYNILKPGGVWVNLGPLLYHFADIPNENSIEPSYEVVREVIEKIGFVIEKEETNVPTTYSLNQESMLQYEYKSVFFVCRKPGLRQNGINHVDQSSAVQGDLGSPDTVPCQNGLNHVDQSSAEQDDLGSPDTVP